jgi:hypothetical protein
VPCIVCDMIRGSEDAGEQRAMRYFVTLAVSDCDTWGMPEEVGDCVECMCYYGAGAGYIFWVAELDGLQKGRHDRRVGAAVFDARG